jgi:hypothetical protein
MPMRGRGTTTLEASTVTFTWSYNNWEKEEVGEGEGEEVGEGEGEEVGEGEGEEVGEATR